MITSIFLQGATGKMGRAIAAIAQQEEAIQIAARPDEADVAIDFSSPEGALAALDICLGQALPLVTGTTGLSAQWREARDKAIRQIAVLESPNMSIGVNLAYALLETAAASIGTDADIDIIETHHRGKRDAPSGTALRMGERISASLPTGKTGAQGEVHYHSLRAGDVPGEHRVKFTLPGETVEISHLAINRSVFAHGALRAARWLKTAPPGLYDMRDLLPTNP